MRVRQTRQRPIYAHGCGGDCGRPAGFCPKRRLTNSSIGETKSAAGKRVIGLPDELVAMLREHRTIQEAERKHAGNLWEEGDWVFATQTGTPLNPNSDYHEWKALLRCPGVRDGRLHDARHTAATVLLVLGVPERAVMGIMGGRPPRWPLGTSTSPTPSGVTWPAELVVCCGRIPRLVTVLLRTN